MVRFTVRIAELKSSRPLAPALGPPSQRALSKLPNSCRILSTAGGYAKAVAE